MIALRFTLTCPTCGHELDHDPTTTQARPTRLLSSMTTPAPAIARRSPELVIAVLGLVYDSDDPVPWLDVLGQLTSNRYPWKTVENTLYDLVAFGALHRVGKPGHARTPDTRALRPTPLGRAWLDRELLDLPRTPEDQ